MNELERPQNVRISQNLKFEFSHYCNAFVYIAYVGKLKRKAKFRLKRKDSEKKKIRVLKNVITFSYIKNVQTMSKKLVLKLS